MPVRPRTMPTMTGLPALRKASRPSQEKSERMPPWTLSCVQAGAGRPAVGAAPGRGGVEALEEADLAAGGEAEGGGVAAGEDVEWEVGDLQGRSAVGAGAPDLEARGAAVGGRAADDVGELAVVGGPCGADGG